MTKDEEDNTKLSSVKYYILNNENVDDFYNEWRFKTMAIIRKKGWGKVLEAGVMIPTDEILCIQYQHNDISTTELKNDVPT